MRGQTSCLGRGHAGPYAARPRLVRRRKHHTTRRTADDHRGAAQLRSSAQLHRGVEGVHVNMHHNAGGHDATSPIEPMFDISLTLLRCKTDGHALRGFCLHDAHDDATRPASSERPLRQ